MISRRRSARGSGYVVTLLVLVVLSMVGLSLAYVVQTEGLVAGSERSRERAFYAAEAGLGSAVARTLVMSSSVDATAESSVSPMVFTVGDEVRIGAITVASRVVVSPVVPILATPCNWCPMNENEMTFFKVSHEVAASAERLGWSGGGPPPETALSLARVRLSEQVELQPWWEPDWRAIAGPVALDSTPGE